VKQHAGKQEYHLTAKTSWDIRRRAILQDAGVTRHIEQLPAGFHPASETAIPHECEPRPSLPLFDCLRPEFFVRCNEPAFVR
jgi:hypothetical protein